jgi:hypothetical protein
MIPEFGGEIRIGGEFERQGDSKDGVVRKAGRFEQGCEREQMAAEGACSTMAQGSDGGSIQELRGRPQRTKALKANDLPTIDALRFGT